MVGMVESGQTMPAMPAIGSSGWLPDGSIVPVTGSW
jgi:hypothetical protein